jgi:hypothetical protein
MNKYLTPPPSVEEMVKKEDSDKMLKALKLFAKNH